MSDTGLLNSSAVDNLVETIFRTLPVPELESEFDRYGILNADGLSCRIYTQSGHYYDTYITWIAAKALNTEPRRRKAVAIEWSTDELVIDPEAVIRHKLNEATSRFNELAEEYDEGGALPKARGILAIKGIRQIPRSDYRETLSVLLDTILDPSATSSNVIAVARELRKNLDSEHVGIPDAED